MTAKKLSTSHEGLIDIEVKDIQIIDTIKISIPLNYKIGNHEAETELEISLDSRDKDFEKVKALYETKKEITAEELQTIETVAEKLQDFIAWILRERYKEDIN